MPRVKPTNRRKKQIPRRRAVVSDKALVRQAEHVLATMRRLKASMEELDPDRRKETRRLLRGVGRQIAAYREGLEILRSHPYAGPALENQIQIFTLLEDECRLDGRRERPV